MRKTFLLISFIMVCVYAMGQTTWNFRIGNNHQSKELDSPYSSLKDNASVFNYMMELGVDLPLKDKLTLETGLRWRNLEFDTDPLKADEEEKQYDGRVNLFEIPFEFGYKYPLWKNTNLRVSAGPYFSFELFERTPALYQAGLTTALRYEYKKVNVGLSYNIACSNKYHNQWDNGLYLTLGVKFNSKAWKTIGATVGALAAVGGQVAAQQNAANNSRNASVTVVETTRTGNGAVRTAGGNSGNKSSVANKNGKKLCDYCAGHGTCSTTKASNRKKFCFGTGNCQYCDGTGWLNAGSDRARCTACPNERDLRGKCATCRGTGKCKYCNGTGYR